jgi:hypothetical protein
VKCPLQTASLREIENAFYFVVTVQIFVHCARVSMPENHDLATTSTCYVPQFVKNVQLNAQNMRHIMKVVRNVLKTVRCVLPNVEQWLLKRYSQVTSRIRGLSFR